MKTKRESPPAAVVRRQSEAVPRRAGAKSGARRLLVLLCAGLLLTITGCRVFFADTQSLDAYLAGAYESPGTVTPTDNLYQYQWHYPMADVPRAWGILQDLGPAPGGAFGTTYIAVIDTGILRVGGSADHEDLVNNIFYNGSASTGGYNFVENSGDPEDPNTPGSDTWHGTHVTGTIAADFGDSGAGSGVVGVGWDRLEVVPIRSLSDAGGFPSTANPGSRVSFISAAALDASAFFSPAKPAIAAVSRRCAPF